MTPTRFAVIVNPRSAGGRTAREWPALRAYFERTVGPLTEYVTDRPRQASELTRHAVRRGHGVIVAVGGDGTLNEVVNGLFERGAPIDGEVALALVPGGTGSDFRRTVQIPLDPRQAIDALSTATARAVDVMRVRYRDRGGTDREHYSINVTSFGMGGIVAERVQRYSRWLDGRLAFALATLVTSAAFRGRDVHLELDGGPRTAVRILNVAVANGQFQGAGMWMCPRARLDDGLLDVTVVEAMPPWRVARAMPLLYNGQVYSHPRVHFHRTTRIEATASEVTLAEMDGEPLGGLPLRIDVLPRALRFLG